MTVADGGGNFRFVTRGCEAVMSVTRAVDVKLSANRLDLIDISLSSDWFEPVSDEQAWD